MKEMGQVDAREAGEIAYMLANGAGKGRAHRDGSARRPAQWRLLFLSSGELSLADKMAEIGRRTKAGQEVRLVDIPADAGASLGIFETLHGVVSAGAFAEQLRLATSRCYGAPIRAFLEKLTARRVDDPAALTELLRVSRDEFLATHLPRDASGQVRSVCGRFALAAAAGSLATAFGLTGWADDEADRAAATCFRAWLAKRGSTGDQEVAAGIRQVKAFIEAHGSSRFEAPWEASPNPQDEAGSSFASKPERISNRVGFRRRGEQEDWESMILPEAWRTDVAKGFDPAALARAMIARDLINPATDGKPSRPVKVPGHKTVRLYCLVPDILSDGTESTDAG
jgi:putative DNA primase/helicase